MSRPAAGRTRSVAGLPAYVLRWLGPIADDEEIRSIARELHERHESRRSGIRFRLLYVGASRPRGLPDTIMVITFREIVETLVRRSRYWQEHELARQSAHQPWHPLIATIWRTIGKSDASDEDIVDKVLRQLGM